MSVDVNPVLPGVCDAGENVRTIPAGPPDAESVTTGLKLLLVGVTATVKLVELPRFSVCDAGVALTEKSEPAVATP